MGTDDQSHATTRAANRRLAQAYDTLPYLPQAEPLLDLERLFGLAALYGNEPIPNPSVLDIGCGAGVQLERIAHQTTGALTGTDISAGACASARARLGERASILEADILDLDPERLGRFDVIYAVGVLFIVPDPVRRRLFELIGACLKPGGVAVLSYYAGSMGALRPPLNRLARGMVDPSAPPQEQVRRLREALGELGGHLRQTGDSLPAQLVRLLASYANDATLFHEVLGADLTSTSTGEIEAALQPHGLAYLSYLHPMPHCGRAGSVERAQGADLFDFLYGGYRYGAFLKGDAGAPSASRGLRWKSGAKRRAGFPAFGQPVQYEDPALGVISVADARTQALLDQLASGAASRPALIDAVRRLGAGAGGDVEAKLDEDLSQLWQAGWLTPLA